MGPPRDHGGDRLYAVVRGETGPLQWGRREITAEMWESGTTVQEALALQWGRREITAEIRVL